MITKIIPENRAGKQNDISFSRTFPSAGAASRCFHLARERLMHPACWQELTGALGPRIKVFTKAGEVHRPVGVDDFLRIDIPGPGTRAGNGYDWVHVAAMEDRSVRDGEESLFAMRLHPAADPQHDNADTAHFFDETASSTFVIHLSGMRVSASYHGRNEVANNKTGDSLDNIRNSLIAGAAVLGLSEVQWSALIRGLLQDEKED